MIYPKMVGEFYHQTTKLTYFILLLIVLTSCTTKNNTPKPIGTIFKIITGNFR